MSSINNNVLIWGGLSPVQAPCPVCGAISEKSHVVSAATPVDSNGRLNFYRCDDCESIFPYPFKLPDYDDDYGFPDYGNYYCEIGAGIDFMIRPIEIVNCYTPIRSFLDAGCGFGFTLDFANRMLGARAVGFDPSAYAREGARVLGIDIRHEYLSASSQLEFERADMILCSEVIEHVEAPEALVRMLRSKLSAGGIIVLTTPNANWITPHKGLLDVLACLFPGFHRQLFSAQALEDLLRKAPFHYVRVLQTGQRLIAFASETRNISDVEDVQHTSASRYRDYLAALVDAFRAGEGPVYSGALYRAFKESVCAGDVPTAHALASEVQAYLSKVTGHDILSSEALDALTKRIISSADFYKLRPFHLSSSLFFLGMYYLNMSGNALTAARMFTAAGKITRCTLGPPNAFLAEPAALYWQMVYHAGLANLLAGDREVSLTWFRQILDSAETLPPDLVQAVVKPQDVARAALQAGIAHLQLGQLDGAAPLLQKAACSAEGLLTHSERQLALSLAREVQHTANNGSASKGDSGRYDQQTLRWASRTPVVLTCLACGFEGLMPHTVTAQHVMPDAGDVHFHRCPKCDSLNADPDSRFWDFGEATSCEGDPSYIDHYVEIGAGIEALVQVLERLGLLPGLSLLDVGCGFGYTLDYWRRASSSEALGLEPSAYGALGRKLLGVEIVSKYLSDAEEIFARRFDRVISGEVIEHVANPAAFLAQLRAILAPGGRIAVTTPAAGFVRPDAPEIMVLSSLSPGLHRVLFSEGALQRLLENAGFAACQVLTENERLIGFAGDTLLQSPTDPRTARDRYIAYLLDRCGEAVPLTPLARGFVYRCFKELVNDGRIEQAVPYGQRLAEGLRHEFGITALNAPTLRDLIAECRDWRLFGRTFGFSTPCFAFYVAMAERQGAVGLAHLGASFSLAAELCRAVVATEPRFFQEAASLYWVAVFEDGLCRRDAGDPSGAREQLGTIVRGDPRACPRGIGSPPPDIIARAAAELEALEEKILRSEPAPTDSRDEGITAHAAAMSPAEAKPAHSRFVALMHRILPESLRPAARRVWHLLRR